MEEQCEVQLPGTTHHQVTDRDLCVALTNGTRSFGRVNLSMEMTRTA